MKLFSLALSALLIATGVLAEENPTGCLVPALPAELAGSDVDVFPVKVTNDYARLWTVDYFSTYKIARNLAENKTYILYQCGTSPPNSTTTSTNEEMGLEPDEVVNEIIQIPLQSGVAITVTPMITFLEQLGVLGRVDFFLTEIEYISSPCFLAHVEVGNVSVAPVVGYAGLIDSDGNTVTEEEAFLGGFDAGETGFDSPTATNFVIDGVLFGDGFQAELPFAHTVEFSSFREQGNKDVFEWVKFYSVFFNKEHVANEVTQAAEDRFECVSEIAASVTADGPKVKALWATYSNWCGGWQLGRCPVDDPNYYCELAERCETDLMTDGVGSIDHPVCGNLMTTEEFVAYGQEAEVWFTTGWDSQYEGENKTMLDTMVSVQNQKVFDNLGSGPNAWFEERVAEYYDVLQDFCHTVGTGPQLNRPAWFRNVFTGGEVGSPGECVGGAITDKMPYTFDFDQCEVSVTTTSTTESETEDEGTVSNNGTSTPASGAVRNGVAMAMAVVSALSMLCM